MKGQSNFYHLYLQWWILSSLEVKTMLNLFFFSQCNVIFGFAPKEECSNVCVILLYWWQMGYLKKKNPTKHSFKNIKRKTQHVLTMFKRFQWNVINYINIVLLACILRNIAECDVKPQSTQKCILRLWIRRVAYRGTSESLCSEQT